MILVKKMFSDKKVQNLLKVFIKNVDFFDNIGYNIDIGSFCSVLARTE